MMREMSYRDKMILLIISVIIILAVGFFALIRPKYNSLVADRGTYETTKTEWEGIDAKIQQIPILKDGITKEYNESKEIAEMFVDEAFQPVNETFDNLKANYVFDKYVQPLIDESELKVDTFTVGGVNAQMLNYYYITPDVLTYSLLESADINGEYAKQVEELLKVSNALAEKNTTEIMANTLELSVKGTKENLMTFLAKLNGEEGAEITGGEEGFGSDLAENAVRVTHIDIADYTFGAGKTEEVQVQTGVDEAGNPIMETQTRQANAEGNGESLMNLSLTFYNAMPIDEPVLGD